MPQQETTYPYPVFGTQGGGLVRQQGERYVFVEPVPECGLDVGDTMPDMWGVIPANDQARRQIEDEEDAE